jgi:hypothetical protein
MLEYRGSYVMRVSVLVDRVERPGWRASSKAVRLSSFAIDPERGSGDDVPSYITPAGEDRKFAERIALEIRRSVSAKSPKAVQAKPIGAKTP